MNKQIFIVVILSSLFVQVGFAQDRDDCKANMKYEDRNNADPSTLTLARLAGIVEDSDHVPIPYACLGLFTERGHKLVARATTNEDGNFDFGLLMAGHYMLVAKYSPFCPSNSPIHIVRRTDKTKVSSKRLIVHMEQEAIDSCSYADYK